MTLRHRALLLSLGAMLAAGTVSLAQRLPSGPQVLTFFSDVDDSEQPYGLYLPKGFDEKKKYPLVIVLHGAGSNHRLGLRRVFGKSNAQGENDVEASRYFPAWPDVDYIVASVSARGTMGYQGIAERDIWGVLEDVKRRFPVDEDRTYLTGYSMGGGGTLWAGLTRPDIWAAIAPVCPAPPFGTTQRAPNALNVPVLLFQGDADSVVVPEVSRGWARRLQDAGVTVTYTEYPGVGHNSWENAYADNGIFKAFARYTRNRHPDRVRFVTDAYKHGSAYWVRIDRFTPGTFASVDARFAGPNRIEIATADLEAFTLNLTGHPRFSRLRPVQLTVDGTSLSTITTSGSVPVIRRGTVWEVGTLPAGPATKRAGLEGPIFDAISRRHVYVYGTADKPSPEERLQRTQVATRAGTWAGAGAFGGRVAVNPRILADVQVRPSDLSSSALVLFGTRYTNAVIASHADRLPLHLTREAEGYGLLYVYPVGGQYMLVSSGLPWFPLTDPAPPAGRGGRGGPGGRAAAPGGPLPDGYDFLPPVQRSLSKLPDYVLFKGSPENIVVSGYFDNEWRLSAAGAEKLRDAGVVTVADVVPSGVAR